tara:strand:- start:23 stop:2878 length:2856 start_codon:yes stop_codon:yes gene_type:complete
MSPRLESTDGDSNGTGDSNGSGNLHVPSQRSKGLYRTFTPTNAGWSLQDYAWDKQANRVTSRAEIKEIGEARRGRGKQTAQPLSRTSSGYPDGTKTSVKKNAGVETAAGRGTKPGVVAKDSDALESAKISLPAPVRLDLGVSYATELEAEIDTKLDTKLEAPMKTRKGKGKRTAKGNQTEPKVETDQVPFARACAVTGCAEMCHPTSKRRVERMFCVHHGQCRDVVVDGVAQRYCQVCYALHPLGAFKNTNRTCNAVLARKRMLRIQRQKRLGAKEADTQGMGDALDLIDTDAGYLDDSSEILGENLNGEGTEAKDAPTQKLRAKKGLVKEKPKPGGKKAAAQPIQTKTKVHPNHSANAGAAPVPTASANHGGWFGMSSNLFGLSSGSAVQPTQKRARFGPGDVEARNQMLLDMEHGALGSYNISSVAIKVPHATPAFLSTVAGGAGPGSRNQQRLAANHTRGALPLNKDDSSPAAPLIAKPNPNLQNFMEHEMNSLIQWMDNTASDGGNTSGGRREEFGFDPFIRPGSLIYGVHAQGFVTAPVFDDLDDAPVSSRTRRHSAKTMLHTLAASGNPSGRLLCNASVALREKEEWCLGEGGTGDGVFGCFNGEICRLDACPTSGEIATTVVKGLPTGFTPGALAASQSCLDTSVETGTFVIPSTYLSPDLAVVCMFQGAHLPVLVESRKDGTTEITVRFMPQGGYHVAAEWVMNDMRDNGELEHVESDGDTDHPLKLRNLQGTATLETVLAHGPMRGLPVGSPLPLFLSPDHALRSEVISAMWRLERETTRKDGLNDADANSNDECGVLPDPLALIAMLGSVLHAVGSDCEPNPRMHRGAVAMATFFNLPIVASRLNVDLSQNKQISANDVIDFFSNAAAKIFATKGTVVLFAATVLSFWCTVVFFVTDLVQEEGQLMSSKHPAGIAASVATVAMSIVLLARVISAERDVLKL